MLPYKTLISVEKKSETPVFLQIANTLSREITNGHLKPGTKLPGARSLAGIIGINRNTVIAAYEELHLQGYIEMVAKKGAYVSRRIPAILPKKISAFHRTIQSPDDAGYPIERRLTEFKKTGHPVISWEFDDGLPDERLSPMAELGRAYRAQFKRRNRSHFGYAESEGNLRLRQQLSAHVNETRGLRTTYENIMITRGSQMGIYLTSQLLLQKGDVVVTGKTSYEGADAAMILTGAKLLKVNVDELGLVTDDIDIICRNRRVRAVYVTTHHHFPTTVTMSACRRMNLLHLSEKYGFAVIEDDYDYDFHYKSAPILPLISNDHKGMVINIGSFSKNFSPSLRLGYIVAPKNVILRLSSYRMIVDRQGDHLLEQAFAELLKEGVLQRHLKKVVPVYKERRDHLAFLLQSVLKDQVSFKIPDGGLAIWVKFDATISLAKIGAEALVKGLKISDGNIYDYEGSPLNATRLGFASLNSTEMEQAVDVLGKVIKGLHK